MWVAFEKARVNYPSPLDQTQTSCVHMLHDHNDILDRACGIGSLEEALARAKQREGK